MEEKSIGVMYDFLKQFEPKSQKSLLGKIVNKIRTVSYTHLTLPTILRV